MQTVKALALAVFSCYNMRAICKFCAGIVLTNCNLRRAKEAFHMIGLGTLINSAFVLVGGALGFLFGKALKDSYQDIMVTHNLRYAVEYGDRLLMMHQGRAELDLAGEARKHLRVEDLLAKFNAISIECGN